MSDAGATVAELRVAEGAAAARGHPWAALAELTAGAAGWPEDGTAARLVAPDGRCAGTGIFDRRDPVAAWRRFSRAEAAVFDESYVVDAVREAVERRAEEGCRRLVAAEADFLPGLVVEQLEDVLLVSAETASADAMALAAAEVCAGMLPEAPRETVFVNDSPAREAFGLERGRRTLSGGGLKGFRVELDGVALRADPLRPEKPGIDLAQREQHVLVGSLCEERRVLDLFARNGAFALHALRGGAEAATAVEPREAFAKAVGAHAQMNGVRIEARTEAPAAFLAETDAGAFDAVVLDPPEDTTAATRRQMLREIFRLLPGGGLLARYARGPLAAPDALEDEIGRAAWASGREARIFARTALPFDFPMRLNFPESAFVRGLVLEVE